MEYTTIIIETADLITKGPLPAMAVAGIAQAIPGIAKGIGALFGRKRINRNLSRAQAVQEGRMRDVENQQFTNTSENVENPYEDWQNSLRTARLQQETAQQLIQQGLNVGAETGAMDPASMAQMYKGVLDRTNQQIQADMGQQEVMGQRMAAAGAMQQQQMIAEGEARREDREMQKRATLLGISNQEYAAAMRAKSANSQAIASGIGDLVGAGVAAFGPKLFGGGKPGLGDATSQDILSGNWKGYTGNTGAWGSGQSLLGGANVGMKQLGAIGLAPGGQFSQYLGAGGLAPLSGSYGVENYLSALRPNPWGTN